jgi:hypothetical protein
VCYTVSVRARARVWCAVRQTPRRLCARVCEGAVVGGLVVAVVFFLSFGWVGGWGGGREHPYAARNAQHGTVDIRGRVII